MSHRETIQKLIEDKTVASVLRRRSNAKEAVQALQTLLYELGFEDELNWQRYEADGKYGGGTTRAVRAFAKRNSLPGDGETLTQPIAEKLIARYDVLDDLRHLNKAIASDKVEKLFYRNSPHSTAVVALQTLLNELGFGEALNWAKYGADGKYGGGTTKAVKAFAGQAGIQSDGGRCTIELAREIINRLKGYFGAKWAKDTTPIEKRSGDFIIHEAVEKGKARVYVSLAGLAQVRFTKFRKGIYVMGNQKPLDFINANWSSLHYLGLSESALNIMVAVSENEGNLDAVNTWDNAFMIFGMFQWTAGTGGGAGELPALVKKIKDANDAVFRKYYGQYGLDVVNTGQVTGYFTINGKKIATPADKELLHTYEYAYYFWLSGQDPVVQSIQIKHALSRVGTFYRSKGYMVKGHLIADLVTSEYGVGLLLDHHVNRPAYIQPCLVMAMDQTGLSDPGNWGTEEERELIHAYLKIRETYGQSPMTDAGNRATVIRKYLDAGTISDKRDSFNYGP